MKWILGAFLMVLNAVIQEAITMEGNISPYHHEMSWGGNSQGSRWQQQNNLQEQQLQIRQLSSSRKISSKLDVSSSLSRNTGNQFYEGGIAKPIINALNLPKYSYRPDYSIFKSKPHWNYLISSTMKNFGNKDRGYGLQQRNRGTLVGYEKLPGYQAISQWCVDRSPDPYTTESYLCSGIIDFGIGLFIESQTLNDLLLCVASQKIVGDNMACIGWLLLRLFNPDILPYPFQSRRFYALMRQGLE